MSLSVRGHFFILDLPYHLYLVVARLLHVCTYLFCSNILALQPFPCILQLAGDFCKLDLTCPLPGCGPHERRHLLLEGGLKFRDANSRLDVYCFLFTDMLLITKANKKGDKVKVTKPPMRLDKCVVQLLRDGSSFMLVYLNEYHVATGVYTFHGDAAKIWVGHVRTAQVKSANWACGSSHVSFSIL